MPTNILALFSLHQTNLHYTVFSSPRKSLLLKANKVIYVTTYHQVEPDKNTSHATSAIDSSLSHILFPIVAFSHSLAMVQETPLPFGPQQYQNPFTIAGLQCIKFNIISETRGTPLPNYKRHAYNS